MQVFRYTSSCRDCAGALLPIGPFSKRKPVVCVQTHDQLSADREGKADAAKQARNLALVATNTDHNFGALPL